MRMNSEELLTAHRARRIGETGVRLVELKVMTRASPAFMYSVIHLWKSLDGVCRSMFCLLEPRALAGTSVLLVETAGVQTEIWLRLSTAARTLRIGASHSREFLLGTDFTYEDLRFWLPVSQNMVHPGTIGFDAGYAAWKFDFTPMDSRRTSASARVYLDAAHMSARRIEWYAKGCAAPERTYECKDLIEVDGIWCPTEIAVSRSTAGYASRMSLSGVSYKEDIDLTFFSPQSMDPIVSLGVAQEFLGRL